MACMYVSMCMIYSLCNFYILWLRGIKYLCTSDDDDNDGDEDEDDDNDDDDVEGCDLQAHFYDLNIIDSPSCLCGYERFLPLLHAHYLINRELSSTM